MICLCVHFEVISDPSLRPNAFAMTWTKPLAEKGGKKTNLESSLGDWDLCGRWMCLFNIMQMSLHDSGLLQAPGASLQPSSLMLVLLSDNCICIKAASPAGLHSHPSWLGARKQYVGFLVQGGIKVVPIVGKGEGKNAWLYPVLKICLVLFQRLHTDCVITWISTVFS